MSEAEQEIPKENDNSTPEGPNPPRWRPFIRYVFPYFLLVYGICFVLIFISASVSSVHILDEEGFLKYGLQVLESTGRFALISGLLVVTGPLLSLRFGGFAVAPLALYAFSIIALLRGYQCRERWIGKALGVSGMILWFFASLMVSGGSI